MIYLQAHELFTENICKFVFHGNGHTFQYFLLLSGSTAIVLYDNAVADPGFPVGGGMDPLGGWTPDAGTFW